MLPVGIGSQGSKVTECGLGNEQGRQDQGHVRPTSERLPQEG